MLYLEWSFPVVLLRNGKRLGQQIAIGTVVAVVMTCIYSQPSAAFTNTGPDPVLGLIDDDVDQFPWKKFDQVETDCDHIIF